RQDHVVERVVGIVGEIGVGVALDDGQALGYAFVDAFARQLDAAAVDAARLQQPEQIAVAAADVEHARMRLHHVGDDQMIDARAARPARRLLHGAIALQPPQHDHDLIGGSPRARPAESRKPRTIAKSSGSSSRNASCPLSVWISANETRALDALSACTISRDSEVGKSQSLVKETTQKRVGVFLNALASTPS